MLGDRLPPTQPNAANAAISTGRQLLTSEVDRVTSATASSAAQFWSVKKDRTLADRVRVQVLDAMVELK
jgi:hypothetical protein